MYIPQTNGQPFPAFRAPYGHIPPIMLVSSLPSINLQSSVNHQSSVKLQSSRIHLQTVSTHSQLWDTTGKDQDASGQEGWPPLHFIFLDRLCTIFALFYFLHDRTPSVCTPVGLIRIPRHCRDGELPLRSSSKHVPTIVVLLCISTDLDYDKRIAYS